MMTITHARECQKQMAECTLYVIVWRSGRTQEKAIRWIKVVIKYEQQ